MVGVQWVEGVNQIFAYNVKIIQCEDDTDTPVEAEGSVGIEVKTVKEFT